MIKPIESLATPTAVVATSAPVKRDEEGLRETAVGVEQIAAMSQDPATEGKNYAAAELEQAINQRIERLLGSNLRLRVESDQDTGKFVYQSVDKRTGEVKRQYPSEDILRLLAFFRELDGLLYDERA